MTKLFGRLLWMMLLVPLLLLAGCASKGGSEDEPQGYDPATIAHPAWMPAPLTSLPYSSRIGIMTVLQNEIVHVKPGTAGFGGFRQTYPPAFDLPAYTTESLRKAVLKNTPYQPVMVRPSARLRRDHAIWQNSWDEKTQRFGDNWQAEFDAIIKQNQLKLLIIVSSPEDAIPGGSRVQGTGLFTRSGLVGGKQVALFSTIRFFRLSGAPDKPAKLLFPILSNAERQTADLPNVPFPTSDELTPATLRAVEASAKNLIDQKVGAFIPLMK